jgi:hypothetical protein
MVSDQFSCSSYSSVQFSAVAFPSVQIEASEALSVHFQSVDQSVGQLFFQYVGSSLTHHRLAVETLAVH